MNKIAFAASLVGIVLASQPPPGCKNNSPTAPSKRRSTGMETSMMSSDQGKLIWMADTKHCSEVSGASDQQTLVCMVMEDPERGNLVPALHLEIYQKGGYKKNY